MARKPSQPKGDGKGKAKTKKPAPTVRVTSSEQVQIKKGAPHRWSKGQSGNPGGRPKEVIEIRDLARQYTSEAIKRLAEIMRSDNERAAVAAINALIDRGWGKAMQAMEVTGKDGAPLVPVLNLSYGAS